MKPSIYQENIWDFIENGTGNAAVNAVAGSGKTTTIVKGLERIKKDADASFFAFNNSVVEELKTRVPDHVKVSTLHSLGMFSVRKAFRKTKLNKNKVQSIIMANLSRYKVEEKEKGGFIYRVSKMVDLVRFYNLKPDISEYLDLAMKYGLDVKESEILASMEVLKISNNKIGKEIDYTDMIYQPVRLDLKLPVYDFVFIDESQDLSVIQQELFKKTLKRNGRFIAVGDPNQAIYGFAGADSESFEKLANLPNVTQFPLSVCYRCGKSIVNKAKEIVPNIEWYEGNDNGSVRNGYIREIRPGDMVLCRNNKPLVQMCLLMFQKNIKASIKGIEFGNELNHIIEQTKHKNLYVSSVRLERVLEGHYNRLHKLGITKPERTNSYRNMSEKIEIIREIIYPEVSNTDDAKNLIKRIFNEKDDKKKVNLSTIHKAKGLESDRVFVLCPELMPSKFASEPWEIKQEQNLQYVCYTRAKKELLFLDVLNEGKTDGIK